MSLMRRGPACLGMIFSEDRFTLFRIMPSARVDGHSASGVHEAIAASRSAL
jgi:hypothetical protein